ncbi:MAG: methyltransferase domain-containing protein [Chloroflexota bacterium]
MNILNFILIFIAILILARIAMKYRHMPAPPLLGPYLDSPIRRWVQPIPQVLERSGIQPGMTVLEIGAGSGAFIPSVARLVGERGKVYALDIQPAMLKQIECKLAKPENRDIKNVELKQASAYELPFKDASLDLVYMVTAFPEIPDRGRALREIKRVLKPSGILADTELLPDPDYPWRSTVIKLARKEGFILEASFGNIWNYTVRFRKPS